MRSALLVTLLIYCLPVLIGQSPQDLAKDLRSTDWKVRNSAALALEKLPSAHLPVDDLVQILNAEDLPASLADSDESIEGIGLGGGAARRRPANYRPPPRSLVDWLRSPSSGVKRADREAPPSRFPRLLTPFGSRTLAAFVLRRSTQLVVSDALSQHLGSSDPCFAMQCALSLAMLGERGKHHLEEALVAGIRPDFTFEALLHTKGFETRVLSLVNHLSHGDRVSILHLIPPGADAVATAIGRHDFVHSDRDLVRQAIHLLVWHDKDAVGFAKKQLESHDETRVLNGLALIHSLGDRGNSLWDDVLSLLDSQPPAIAQWAIECLGGEQLSADQLETFVGSVAKHVLSGTNEDTRYVALLALVELPSIPGGVLDALPALAEQGQEWHREAALRALAKHHAWGRLGSRMESVTKEALDFPNPGRWVIAAMENLPESVATKMIQRKGVPPPWEIAWALREIETSRLQSLSVRVNAWTDRADRRLNRTIQLIDLVTRYRAGSGLPEAFLDPSVHSSFELRMRTRLILDGGCLLDRDAPLLLAAIAARESEEDLDSYLIKYPSEVEFIRAAVAAAHEHAFIRQRARETPSMFRSLKLDEATVLPLLDHQDPDLVEIGRRLIMSSDPFHARAVPLVLKDLRSGNSPAIPYTLDDLRDAPRPPVLPTEILSAVQDLLTNPKHRREALDVLLQWSQ